DLVDVDQHTHETAENCTAEEHEHEGGRRRPAQALDQHRGEHPAQRHHRAHREIDPARQDHESRAESGDGEKRVVREKIERDSHATETRVLRCADEKQQHEQAGSNQDRQVTAVRHHALGLCSTGAARLRHTCRCSGPDCSSNIARIATALISKLNCGGMPLSRMPVVSDWMISTPTSVSHSENRPPESAAPPMTTARIASSSSHNPALFASAP